MARRRSHRRYFGGGRVVRHRRRHGGGLGRGRWSIEFTDAALSAVSGTIGSALKGVLPAGTPQFIQNAPLEALGMYALGAALNRQSLRSCGAGLAMGQLIGVATVGA